MRRCVFCQHNRLAHVSGHFIARSIDHCDSHCITDYIPNFTQCYIDHYVDWCITNRTACFIEFCLTYYSRHCIYHCTTCYTAHFTEHSIKSYHTSRTIAQIIVDSIGHFAKHSTSYCINHSIDHFIDHLAIAIGKYYYYPEIDHHKPGFNCDRHDNLQGTILPTTLQYGDSRTLKLTCLNTADRYDQN